MNISVYWNNFDIEKVANSLGSQLESGLRHSQGSFDVCVVDKKTIYDLLL